KGGVPARRIHHGDHGYSSSGPGDSGFHEFFQHELLTANSTASEFTPLTWIYSNPSWDQYLTVDMPMICRGLSSPLYPGWCVPPR
ncbi:hypothetical protein PIB30_012224, partial [Stylosanthes scabra]|nr:hypothetical protein [Stylosanthes scabra]